jgi:3-deoxy-7-phosphoheptulonate synthase
MMSTAPTASMDSRPRTSDLGIRALDPLPAPRSLLEAMPLGTARSDLVTTSRREVRDVLTG